MHGCTGAVWCTGACAARCSGVWLNVWSGLPLHRHRHRASRRTPPYLPPSIRRWALSDDLNALRGARWLGRGLRSSLNAALARTGRRVPCSRRATVCSVCGVQSSGAPSADAPDGMPCSQVPRVGFPAPAAPSCVSPRCSSPDSPLRTRPKKAPLLLGHRCSTLPELGRRLRKVQSTGDPIDAEYPQRNHERMDRRQQFDLPVGHGHDQGHRTRTSPRVGGQRAQFARMRTCGGPRRAGAGPPLHPGGAVLPGGR